jgi:hypothetical protein
VRLLHARWNSAALGGAAGYASPAAFSDCFVAAMAVASGRVLLAALAGAALPARVARRALIPAPEGRA